MATATRSVSSSSQTPACLTSPRRAVRGLSRRSAISSISAAPTRSRSSLTARSPAAPPGRFQTKVITKGVEPVIQAHYKHSKVKQYFKEGRALRTETTVNDPYDFGVKRTLTAETWRQLRSIGDDINDRLLDAQLQACSCAPDPSTLQRLVSPSIEDGQPAPALHFGDPRVMALLACLCTFQHLFAGLTNRTLRPQIAELIAGYTTGQMTYDLRRLRRKGLIRRIPKSQRYELTAFGRRKIGRAH